MKLIHIGLNLFQLVDISLQALTLLRPIAASLNGEDARLMHEAHARLFDQVRDLRAGEIKGERNCNNDLW